MKKWDKVEERLEEEENRSWLSSLLENSQGERLKGFQNPFHQAVEYTSWGHSYTPEGALYHLSLHAEHGPKQEERREETLERMADEAERRSRALKEAEGSGSELQFALNALDYEATYVGQRTVGMMAGPVYGGGIGLISDMTSSGSPGAGTLTGAIASSVLTYTLIFNGTEKLVDRIATYEQELGEQAEIWEEAAEMARYSEREYLESVLKHGPLPNEVDEVIMNPIGARMIKYQFEEDQEAEETELKANITTYSDGWRELIDKHGVRKTFSIINASVAELFKNGLVYGESEDY